MQQKQLPYQTLRPQQIKLETHISLRRPLVQLDNIITTDISKSKINNNKTGNKLGRKPLPRDEERKNREQFPNRWRERE